MKIFKIIFINIYNIFFKQINKIINFFGINVIITMIDNTNYQIYKLIK